MAAIISSQSIDRHGCNRYIRLYVDYYYSNVDPIKRVVNVDIWAYKTVSDVRYKLLQVFDVPLSVVPMSYIALRGYSVDLSEPIQIFRDEDTVELRLAVERIKHKIPKNYVSDSVYSTNSKEQSSSDCYNTVRKSLHGPPNHNLKSDSAHQKSKKGKNAVSNKEMINLQIKTDIKNSVSNSPISTSPIHEKARSKKSKQDGRIFEIVSSTAMPVNSTTSCNKSSGDSFSSNRNNFGQIETIDVESIWTLMSANSASANISTAQLTVSHQKNSRRRFGIDDDFIDAPHSEKNPSIVHDHKDTSTHEAVKIFDTLTVDTSATISAIFVPPVAEFGSNQSKNRNKRRRANKLNYIGSPEVSLIDLESTHQPNDSDVTACEPAALIPNTSTDEQAISYILSSKDVADCTLVYDMRLLSINEILLIKLTGFIDAISKPEHVAHCGSAGDSFYIVKVVECNHQAVCQESEGESRYRGIDHASREDTARSVSSRYDGAFMSDAVVVQPYSVAGKGFLAHHALTLRRCEFAEIRRLNAQCLSVITEVDLVDANESFGELVESLQVQMLPTSDDCCKMGSDDGFEYDLGDFQAEFDSFKRKF